jgi:hypothetical protein
MLPWMIAGIVIVAFFVIWVIRDAQQDDRRRKAIRRPRDDY